jgi:hypothetical protein
MIDSTVEFNIPGASEPLTFHFRDGSSPAAFALITELEAKLRSWRFDTEADHEQQIAVAREFGAALFPDEERTQRVMRIILAGPHDRINWYLDAAWPRLVAIAADWFTRAKGDIHRAEREEATRMDRVAGRIKEQLGEDE